MTKLHSLLARVEKLASLMIELPVPGKPTVPYVQYSTTSSAEQYVLPSSLSHRANQMMFIVAGCSLVS